MGAPELLAEAARRAEAGEDVAIVSALVVEGTPPCRVGQQLLVGTAGPLAGSLGCAETDLQAVSAALDALRAGAPRRSVLHHELGNVEVWVEPYLSGSRALLVVLGATPVAAHLLSWAPALGWRTALVEARPERAEVPAAHLAERVVSSVAELELPAVFDGVHTDHDAPGVVEDLASLLRSGARFVALVASASHGRGLVEALLEAGVAPSALSRLNTPAGVDLGGREAPEVALSLLAGLVAQRHGASGGWLAAVKGGLVPGSGVWRAARASSSAPAAG